MIKRAKGADHVKCTAKQWAVDMVLGDLELVTDYYYERYQHLWDQMTEREQHQVREQIDRIHNRIVAMLEKAGGK